MKKQVSTPSRKAPASKPRGAKLRRARATPLVEATQNTTVTEEENAEALGWGIFDRNGGEVIKRVDTSGQSESIGASAKIPQVRLRPVSKFPKTARKVLDDHHLTFAGYKRVKRQVRALAMMGETFILTSRKSKVILDRHPDFDAFLIERELARWKSDAVNSFLSDLTDFIENMPKETLPKEVAPKQPGKKSKYSLVDFPIKKDQIDDNLGPYGQQEQLLKRWVGLMKPELIEGVKQFIEERRKQIEDAKLRKPKGNDLDRTEVD